MLAVLALVEVAEKKAWQYLMCLADSMLNLFEPEPATILALQPQAALDEDREHSVLTRKTFVGKIPVSRESCEQVLPVCTALACHKVSLDLALMDLHREEMLTHLVHY